VDCFLLPGAAAVIAGGEAHKNTTLPTQNKNWPSDKRPHHALTEYKSFSPEEIRLRMRQSKGGVLLRFAQLAPILFPFKTNKYKKWLELNQSQIYGALQAQPCEISSPSCSGN